MSKLCKNCDLVVAISSFYKNKAKPDGLSSWCRDCSKQYRLENRTYFIDYANSYNADYYEANAEVIKQQASTYYYSNKAILRPKRTAYHKRKRHSDIVYKLPYTLRTRLYSALKANVKSGSAVRDLGCSIPALKIHLESKFLPGMSWDNHGKWHIDHIVSLSNFDLSIREELLIACNYNNLQPMWAKDNLRKSKK